MKSKLDLVRKLIPNIEEELDKVANLSDIEDINEKLEKALFLGIVDLNILLEDHKIDQINSLQNMLTELNQNLYNLNEHLLDLRQRM